MRTIEVTKKREALEELVRSEGWQIFAAHVRKEWLGEGFHARMGSAFCKDKAVEPFVVHRTSRELLTLLDWPNTQISELKGSPENE